jgi:hypothetical protein
MGLSPWQMIRKGASQRGRPQIHKETSFSRYYYFAGAGAGLEAVLLTAFAVVDLAVFLAFAFLAVVLFELCGVAGVPVAGVL